MLFFQWELHIVLSLHDMNHRYIKFFFRLDNELKKDNLIKFFDSLRYHNELVKTEDNRNIEDIHLYLPHRNYLDILLLNSADMKLNLDINLITHFSLIHILHSNIRDLWHILTLGRSHRRRNMYKNLF